MESRDEYYSYIKESISIKELCDKFGIQTMQTANDYICSCIYHSDPHPSMHIYTGSKSFYCFECDKGGDIFTFLLHKFKKYPSVALKEDINPAPAYEKDDAFIPVMDRYLSDLKGRLAKKGSIANHDMFDDVRDDVIELICAELFAVASISNYPSFLQESLKAYVSYFKPDIFKRKMYTTDTRKNI